MAEKQPPKKKRQLKKPETVRERAQKKANESKDSKPRRLHRVRGKVTRPAKKVWHVGKREYYLPAPNTKLGRWLNKRRSVLPLFLINAFKELRQVTWPNRRETAKMTIAVVLFAIIFGGMIAGVDYVLDKAFREFIL